MSIPFQDSSIQGNFTAEEFSINFVGKELFYSRQTLREVQNEFGVATHRIDSIQSLPVCPSSGSGRVIIVDQMSLDDLIARPKAYKDCVGSGSVAFAYRKDEAARFLFENWDRNTYGEIGYLPMNVSPDVWRSILRLLLHEEFYMPCFLADSVAANNGQPKHDHPAISAAADPHPIYSKLTPREKQVLQLVSKGQSNKIIASNLGITEHTVKLHIHNVVGKIGVSNRTAAAQFFFEVAPNEAHEMAVD
ncbi:MULTISPECIES: response regulator transcription factor [unclassified Ruegeria]|uniref:helix-turn-helix transcriptional regulator n=1 Tax=unclassified Ruegeria TaxID=2625375 RepID=UPI0020C2223B|nr:MULTISPECIES: response regulator transcription factor [unclassified Ruegeria]